jgi:hypothetical protein
MQERPGATPQHRHGYDSATRRHVITRSVLHYSSGWSYEYTIAAT